MEPIGMKRVFILCVLLTMALSMSSQNISEMREYFQNNKNYLDPIEGFYDVETEGDYVTPFVHQKYAKEQLTLVIKRNYGNNFDVYIEDNEGEIGMFDEIKIKKIGETNVYYFSFETSKCRTYLIDNHCHFIAKLQFDYNTAVKFTGNKKLAPSVKIHYSFDCIKTYPNN